MTTVLVQATQGQKRKITVTISEHELGQANIRRGCAMLRERGICVFAHERFVTTELGEIYLADEDMQPVVRLTMAPKIAALIDAGNALVAGAILRPLSSIQSQPHEAHPVLLGRMEATGEVE